MNINITTNISQDDQKDIELLTPEKFDKLIRGKNINFLIGSGASTPMYPTLSFGDKYPSFEDIVSDTGISKEAKMFMYLFYFKKWISPMALNRTNFYEEYGSCKTVQNYERYIYLLYNFLINESNEQPKRINIFTTNYDLTFERMFDEFLIGHPLIYFNDGSRGFFKRYISTENFYLNITHSGYNDSFRREVPTINLFKLHGSVSWNIDENDINQDRIIVEEENSLIHDVTKISDEIPISIEKMEAIVDSCICNDIGESVHNLELSINDLTKKRVDDEKLSTFFETYMELPIINPDKYKFSKTVLEQHYYQLIRSFSYELEKKNSILIVFGFSFADEHIKDVFKRSLLNPYLMVFIISFSKSEQSRLKNEFKGYNNIFFLPEDFSRNKRGDFEYLLYLLGDSNE